MHKDVKELVREMADKGWTHAISGGGHVRLIHPSGRAVVTSLTPSDRRSMLNARAQIRRLERTINQGERE